MQILRASFYLACMAALLMFLPVTASVADIRDDYARGSGGPDLVISPTFVMFSDRERSKEISLLNTSSKRLTYRIEWIHNKMDENGRLRKMDGSLYDFDFEEVVRFSPRQVTLPPNGRQSVRLSLRRPENLPPGDYHAHLSFTRLPSEGSMPSADLVPSGESEGAGIRLNLGIAVAIPVFFTVGERDIAIELGEPRFEQAQLNEEETGPVLMVPVTRHGNHSAIGRLQAIHIAPDGRERQIGFIRNANIYSEIDHRVFRLPLNTDRVEDGVLLLRYQENIGSDFPVRAEKRIPIRP